MKLPYGELGDEDFQKFCELIYHHAGIRIQRGKQVMVANRLRRRLRETGIESFLAYYEFLTSPLGASEIPRFLDEITTHETYFYRDKAHFDWFGTVFLPEMTDSRRRARGVKRLRVWSAACSTGEEIYSLALQVLMQKPLLSGWDVSLFGTDLSGASLATARTGTYGKRSLRLVPKEQIETYFTPESDELWTVKPEVRQLATWKQHNLLRRLDGDPFDCIFLKNVLIYFDEHSKRAVVRNLLASLAPGGYLVVGLTEGVHAMLEPLMKHSAWLYQRSDPISTAHPNP